VLSVRLICRCVCKNLDGDRVTWLLPKNKKPRVLTERVFP
jgi:hypothetical protein